MGEERRAVEGVGVGKGEGVGERERERESAKLEVVHVSNLIVWCLNSYHRISKHCIVQLSTNRQLYKNQ